MTRNVQPFVDIAGIPRLDLPEGMERTKDEKLVVVLERHNFTRGCLCSWIRTFCQDYRLTSFPDAHSPLLPPVLGSAALAILSAAAVSREDGWLVREVSCLRTLRPDLAIIAIIDETEPSVMTETALRLGLQGYIPTTSTLEVAAAVLHLVAAGGTYIPHLPDHPEPSPASQASAGSAALNDTRLTPRESKVLDLLAQGMSNKAIAYRLSLSESTVKVHVHRILSKFNVHNRTEAVVSAYRLHVHANGPQAGRVRSDAPGPRTSGFPAAKVAELDGTAPMAAGSAPVDHVMG